jgi:hypothetical protein
MINKNIIIYLDIRPSIVSGGLVLYLFKLQICDTINDSSKESKKQMIPDALVLLFLQIIDDVLNNR